MNSHKTLNLKLEKLANVVATSRLQREQWQGPTTVSGGPSEALVLVPRDDCSVASMDLFPEVVWGMTLYWVVSTPALWVPGTL